MVLEKQLLHGTLEEDRARTSKRSKISHSVASETTSNWIELARLVQVISGLCTKCYVAYFYPLILVPLLKFSVIEVRSMPYCTDYTSLWENMMCLEEYSVVTLEQRRSPRML